MSEKRQPSISVSIDRGIRMKKSFGLFHCVSILCAITGNVSVFIAPTAILGNTGSVGLSLVMWSVGAVMNLFMALCFTELATMFPKAGGPYAYITKVFGPFFGFMVMWGYTFMISGPFWALMSYTSAIYIIQPFFGECSPPGLAVKLLAGWILVTFSAVNCVYVKIIKKVQSLLTFIKLLALLIIIVCGAVRWSQDDGGEHLENIWEGTVEDPMQISMAFFFSIFTYGGWQIVTNLMEEVKDPGRDLPLAIYMTFIIIALEFVLVNLAYLVVLPTNDIMTTSTVAVLFFERFYPPFKAVISILVSLTALGVLNASILGHARMVFAASRNNQAPVLLSMIHTQFLTPWPAVIALCLNALLMLFTGGVFSLIELISLFSIMMSLGVVLALLYFRWVDPKCHRPYKASFFIPISTLILIIVVLGFSIYHEPYKLGRGFLVLSSGIPVYILGIKWKSKPKGFFKVLHSTTISLQTLMKVRKSS